MPLTDMQIDKLLNDLDDVALNFGDDLPGLALNSRGLERSREVVRAALADASRPAEDVAPQRLLDLADRIDHERLWASAGLERAGWTQEQHDRCDAGVHLRRYADLLGSNSWRIYPPKGIPTRFSATTLDAAIAMAKREEARR